MVLNVCDLPLLINIWIYADELVQMLSIPCICHQTPLPSLVFIVIITNSLLSFPLLIVISGLFPPICMRDRMTQLLRLTS